MRYIDYHNMKDFCTIAETCRLFEMDKNALKSYAEKYSINPQQDQFDNWGFRKTLVCQLHNHIYKEQKTQDLFSVPTLVNSGNDPWA
ncbi:MAG: hypothetical protein PHE09_16775 [Oscillospiraceae bacterium]|nr:hypothetical protein [Oscillospiraceae bacterium]